MTEAGSPVSARSYRRLKLNFVELMILGGMMLCLAVSAMEAIDGQHVGKSDALQVARMQGQQGLMAASDKHRHP